MLVNVQFCLALFISITTVFAREDEEPNAAQSEGEQALRRLKDEFAGIVAADWLAGENAHKMNGLTRDGCEQMIQIVRKDIFADIQSGDSRFGDGAVDVLDQTISALRCKFEEIAKRNSDPAHHNKFKKEMHNHIMRGLFGV